MTSRKPPLRLEFHERDLELNNDLRAAKRACILLRLLVAPIAQLDRASDYGSEGCKFNSYWVHHCHNDLRELRSADAVRWIRFQQVMSTAPNQRLYPRGSQVMRLPGYTGRGEQLYQSLLQAALMQPVA
jgi:hypothetical protein